MYLTLSQAAKEIGKSKGTLSKAVKDGKLSVAKKDENGSFQIDPAELFRAFPKQEKQGETSSTERNTTPESTNNRAFEQSKNALERAYVSTIEDLRRRLDDAEKRLDQERQEAREERERFMLWLEYKPEKQNKPESESELSKESDSEAEQKIEVPRRRWFSWSQEKN